MNRVRLLSVLVVLLPALLGLPGAEPASLEYRLTRESEPYVESVTGWTVAGTAAMIAGRSSASPADAEEVRRYFAAIADLARVASARGAREAAAPEVGEARARIDAERPFVESAIQTEVAKAAQAAGLTVEIAGWRRLFPPVFFKFESPPSLLVVSPRDHIERAGTVLLRPGLGQTETAEVEARASSDRISALVTPIGGLGVYPSMVPESSDPRWTFRTVAHEWTHQFLALRPLGWKYAFGAESDERMITLNETVAETIGTELGDTVFREYYPDAEAAPTSPRSPRDSVFRAEMREIRGNVDRMLGQGKIAEAEGYMEASREKLAAEGFYIRKLNQAYFAFYGSYAEDPSFASPTGSAISQRVRALRASSRTLGDFLWSVSSAGSYSQFLGITKGS